VKGEKYFVIGLSYGAGSPNIRVFVREGAVDTAEVSGDGAWMF
jgi:hypothetical protein